MLSVTHAGGIILSMPKRRKLNAATKIVLGFILVISLGTFLLCLPIANQNGQWFPFIDSLFTATSTVCVTGLSVVDVAVQFSLFGQIVVLLLIQIGGLGFVTITSLVFLLIGKKISYSDRKAIQEALNQDKVQGVVKMIRNVVILVFVTELIGFIALLPSMVNLFGGGEGFFKALFLAVSAFCNAGFDVLGTAINPNVSLTGLAQNALVLLPIMLLIIVGSTGFTVLFEIGGKFKHRKMTLHAKVTLWMMGILLLFGAVSFALLEWNNPATLGNMSVGGKILNACFMSVTPRTAGFFSIDCAQSTNGSLALTCILMFIGGGSASMAGGIKLTTLFCLLLAMFRPTRHNGDVIFAKKRISIKIVRKCMRVVWTAILLIAVGTFLICIFEGDCVPLTTVLFDTIAALSTAGLSIGLVATAGWASKLVLIILMFIGRVGAITLTVAMTGKTGDASEEIQYPDAKIMVG